jgi:hypothetical protein
MALDRDAERVLETALQSGTPPCETVTAAEARRMFRAVREVLCPVRAAEPALDVVAAQLMAAFGAG